MTRLPSLLVALLCALAAAACGGDSGAGAAAPPTVDLALDFTPNAIHAPVYSAVRTGADRRHGIRLRIRKPGAGPDALKLIATGRVAVGFLDIHDLAIAREQGADLVAIGAVVGKPLAALVARPGIERPKDLEGRTVGVSGLPSDPAFLRAILASDGADVDRVKQVTIGFNAVARLLSGRVDAAPVFWNAEGVAARERGLDIEVFRVEDYGAPAYPEVVLVTARRTLERRRAELGAVVAAIADGMDAALGDPGAAVRQIARAAGTRDVDLIRAQFDAVAPVFARDLQLDREVLERWADFDARIGIVSERPDVSRAFAFDVRP